MGGTWDLFRYPGIRSDSDMFTLGFPFKPWTREKSIADGRTILGYIHETAAEYGIEQHIRYPTKVVGADWSATPPGGRSRSRRPSGPRTMTCGFLYSCAGYYDYDAATRRTSPASRTSRARSCTRSSGPRTWPTRASGSWSSAAAPPP